MQNSKYKKSYSILGVFQDDDWNTVRTAYKRQIRRWHPDRFQDTDQRKIAEDKSKDINLAYQMLDDYFQKFGSLPPDDIAQHETTTTTEKQWQAGGYNAGPEQDNFYAAGHDQTSFSSSAQPQRRGFTRIVVTGIVIVIGYLMLEPLFTGSQHTPETVLLGFQDSGPAAGNLTVDQTKSLAPPMASVPGNATDEHSDWQVTGEGLSHAPKPSPLSIRPTAISVGSSKQDVLAIQGRPLRITDTAWDYGLSRINFQDGKVTDWYENPMNPLNIKK